MDPGLIAGLIQISPQFNLMKGLFKGIQTAKERKAAKKDYMELLGKRIGMVKGEFKPKRARYDIEKDLPAWDMFMKKAILGSYGQAFGQEGAEMPSAAELMSQMFAPAGMPGGADYGRGVMREPGGFQSAEGGYAGAMGELIKRRGFGQGVGEGRGRGGGYERY